MLPEATGGVYWSISGLLMRILLSCAQTISLRKELPHLKLLGMRFLEREGEKVKQENQAAPSMYANNLFPKEEGMEQTKMRQINSAPLA